MNDKYWEEEIETMPREKLRNCNFGGLKDNQWHCCKFSLL